MSNARQFAIELFIPGTDSAPAAWVRCEEDGHEYRAASRTEAETEARFSLDDGSKWMVVEVPV